MTAYSQGDILRIEGIRWPLLVTSQDFFNKEGQFIACPILSQDTRGPLHIPIQDERVEGSVRCEALRYFDGKNRRVRKVSSIGPDQLIDIVDAIQGIFDYV